MGFFSNIQFNKSLTKNSEVTVTYSGALAQNNPNSLTIVYGFGDNWENTTEQEMKKNEFGYSAKIKIADYDKLNFCFRNSNYEWDNNYYQNYVFPISEQDIEEAFILNENIINEILDKLFDNNISEIIAEQQAELESLNTLATSNPEEFEGSIVEGDPTTPIELVENSVVSEENIEINLEETEPINIEETLTASNIELELCEDLNKMFDELFESAVDAVDAEEAKNQVEEKSKKTLIENFDMDSLVEEILSPVVNSTVSNDEAQNEFEESKEESLLEDLNSTTALIEVDQENSFVVSNRALSKFYMFRKKIKLAFYKLFSAIPKILSSALGEDKE